jgi:hypothetical protein
MTAKDALTYWLTSTRDMLGMFLAELSDDDLQIRPVPAANNIAWQIGHLIASETFLGAELGFKYPAIPPVIQVLGSGASSQTHPDGGKLTKAQYLELFNSVRGATIAGLAAMSDADLDKPNAGNMKDFAPTYAALLGLVGNHTMMHCGQFSVVRRALKKPVLF